MGRRSINTTKSGKYMNPTDQARKEARKKELKKNKRQRQMVRAAVLKNKDPAQMLDEMEKIDEMEYNVLQPSPLNEKVLRDKRKKLKETFDRVMRLYHTEEPELWSELKRKEVEYEKKRLKKQQYYESVKHAQSVQIDEIPLPSATQAPPTVTTGSTTFTGAVGKLPPPPTALSLPPFATGTPPGILKKNNDNLSKTENTSNEVKSKDPPSVPPGPPPDLFDMPELDTDAEDDEVILREYRPKSKPGKTDSKKPNSLQQRMLAISGQNIDEFMKEMETVHRRKEREAAAGKRDEYNPDSEVKFNKDKESDDESIISSHNSDIEEDADSEPGQLTKRIRRVSEGEQETTNAFGGVAANAIKTTPMPVLTMPPQPAPGLPGVRTHLSIPAPPMPPVAGIAPPMLFRPPPMRPPTGMPNFGIRMPPGPPPRPHGMGGIIAPRMGIRMPPGPPPGMPPRMAHHHKSQQQQQQHVKDAGKGVTTITAKPQIRNLSADVTRFVPSTLRVKREETRKPNRTKAYNTTQEQTLSGDASKAATKDDAYLQFMNEMQGLL